MSSVILYFFNIMMECEKKFDSIFYSVGGRGTGGGNKYGYIDGYTASINDKGDTIWHKQ
jgi:hypothetical protein